MGRLSGAARVQSGFAIAEHRGGKPLANRLVGYIHRDDALVRRCFADVVTVPKLTSRPEA